jgi:hypothetical protein
MKRLCLLIFTALAALTVGCSTIDKLYDHQVVTTPGAPVATNTVYRTNVVQLVLTNTVTVTNTATGEVVKSNAVQLVAQPIITAQPQIVYAPDTYTTNLVPRATISAPLNTVGSSGIPIAAPIAIGLGWLYSAYAAIRNKNAARALVTGIEAGRQFLQTTPEGQKADAKIKDYLVQHQEAAGVVDLVGKLVAQHTGDTTATTGGSVV